jgi:hypothetical protein
MKDRWYRLLAYFGWGPELSSDCRHGKHMACEWCYCVCHGFSVKPIWEKDAND